jgi:hypothetical protein
MARAPVIPPQQEIGAADFWREALPQSELLRLSKQELSVLLRRTESELWNLKEGLAEFPNAHSRRRISGRASGARARQMA